MSCPFFTSELKSAWSAEMRPDTCAPTCTVTSADKVPVAVTRATIRPRWTFAVSNSGGGLGPKTSARTPAATGTGATTLRRGGGMLFDWVVTWARVLERLCAPDQQDPGQVFQGDVPAGPQRGKRARLSRR